MSENPFLFKTQVKAGDLIFKIGTTFFSKLIVAFQKMANIEIENKQGWSHVAFALTDGTIELDVDKILVNSDGFILDSTYPFNRMAPINKVLKNKWCICRHKYMTPQKANAIAKYMFENGFSRFMNGYVGKPYDFVQIVSYPLTTLTKGVKSKNKFNSKSLFVCSEFVYSSFTKCETNFTFKYEINDDNVGPMDLFYSNEISLITSNFELPEELKK